MVFFMPTIKVQVIIVCNNVEKCMDADSLRKKSTPKYCWKIVVLMWRLLGYWNDETYTPGTGTWVKIVLDFFLD